MSIQGTHSGSFRWRDGFVSLEAMTAGKTVLAYCNVFSRGICADHAFYFKNQLIWPWNSIGRIKV